MKGITPHNPLKRHPPAAKRTKALDSGHGILGTGGLIAAGIGQMRADVPLVKADHCQKKAFHLGAFPSLSRFCFFKR
jgi:hypothetical protein